MSNKYEKSSEKLVGWLANFADQQAKKQASASLDEKSAGYMDHILNIVNRNKTNSVEAKVDELRQRVGLDLIENNIEKSGGNEEPKKATASRRPLSIRDKVATSANDATLDKVKDYITQVIFNRNGAVATPAIYEQLVNYMNVDKDWMLANSDALEKIVNEAREKFTPKSYHDAPVNELARTDDPSRGDREPPPFLPPASPSVS